MAPALSPRQALSSKQINEAVQQIQWVFDCADLNGDGDVEEDELRTHFEANQAELACAGRAPAGRGPGVRDGVRARVSGHRARGPGEGGAVPTAPGIV